MIELSFAAVFFGAFVALGVYLYRWQYRRADARVTDWAERSRLRIISKERANPLGTGPQAMRAGNKQIIYRITVVDLHGIERRGVVKVGSESSGVLADTLEVVWDDS